jgi:hypothetical protein
MVIIPVIKKVDLHPIVEVRKARGEAAKIFPIVPTAEIMPTRVANCSGGYRSVNVLNEPINIGDIPAPISTLPKRTE